MAFHEYIRLSLKVTKNTTSLCDWYFTNLTILGWNNFLQRFVRVSPASSARAPAQIKEVMKDPIHAQWCCNRINIKNDYTKNLQNYWLTKCEDQNTCFWNYYVCFVFYSFLRWFGNASRYGGCLLKKSLWECGRCIFGSKNILAKMKMCIILNMWIRIHIHYIYKYISNHFYI